MVARLGPGGVTMSSVQAARVASATPASVAFLLFALVAWATTTGAIAPWDEAIRADVHTLASDGATTLALALSFIGSAVVWGPLTIAAIVFFWRLGWRHARPECRSCCARRAAGDARPPVRG